MSYVSVLQLESAQKSPRELAKKAQPGLVGLGGAEARTSNQLPGEAHATLGHILGSNNLHATTCNSCAEI